MGQCVELSSYAGKVVCCAHVCKHHMATPPTVGLLVPRVRGLGPRARPVDREWPNDSCPASYGEATGITQTIRNYAARLGLAILGTVLVAQMRSR
jgi:hypothetical protein